MIRSALPEAPLFFGLFAVTDRVKSDRLFVSETRAELFVLQSSESNPPLGAVSMSPRRKEEDRDEEFDEDYDDEYDEDDEDWDEDDEDWDEDDEEEDEEDDEYDEDDEDWDEDDEDWDEDDEEEE
jgi:hypothetical protein